MSGQQVSPTEIENTLLAYPDRLVSDVAVAGVSGGRSSDEKVPRAWVVLSEEGQRRGVDAAIKALDDWTQQNLSKFKWLRGGIEVVPEVRVESIVDGLPQVLMFLRVDTSEPHWQGSASGASTAL